MPDPIDVYDPPPSSPSGGRGGLQPFDAETQYGNRNALVQQQKDVVNNARTNFVNQPDSQDDLQSAAARRIQDNTLAIQSTTGKFANQYTPQQLAEFGKQNAALQAGDYSKLDPLDIRSAKGRNFNENGIREGNLQQQQAELQPGIDNANAALAAKMTPMDFKAAQQRQAAMQQQQQDQADLLRSKTTLNNGRAAQAQGAGNFSNARADQTNALTPAMVDQIKAKTGVDNETIQKLHAEGLLDLSKVKQTDAQTQEVAPNASSKRNLEALQGNAAQQNANTNTQNANTNVVKAGNQDRVTSMRAIMQQMRSELGANSKAGTAADALLKKMQDEDAAAEAAKKGSSPSAGTPPSAPPGPQSSAAPVHPIVQTAIRSGTHPNGQRVHQLPSGVIVDDQGQPVTA